jgi:hypothetical protein
MMRGKQCAENASDDVYGGGDVETRQIAEEGQEDETEIEQEWCKVIVGGADAGWSWSKRLP